MSETKKSKNKSLNENLSQNLAELRNLALTVTHSDKIGLKYDPKQPTSFYNPETDEITLSLAPYPDFVINHERIAKKCLDGDNLHECLHFLLSKPNWEYYNNWATKIKRNRGSPELAKSLVNIVEDKRVNYFGELRYRLDFGKRLRLANLILKDTIETAEKTGKTQYSTQFGEAPLILGILSNVGLYEADIPKAWQILSPKAKEATEKALSILEATKFQRFKIDIIGSMQAIYDLIEPFFQKGSDFSLKMYIPQRKGGQIKGELSQELQQALEAQVKAEEQKEAQDKAKELLEDLIKGAGAGEGTGNEIPTPEPDFAEYERLVDRNKEQITELLNKLKQTMKPRYQREIFRNRGKLMPQLVSRAYVQSFHNEVKNIYLNSSVKMEREKVAIGFLFDYSGSVDRTEAQDITTQLNEVFGNYVDDLGFAIACFGADSQKVKTFFETFANTRARVGNISVSASGTEIGVLLASFLKMFNRVNPERRKILVIASDFCFGDNERAEELIELYSKAEIEIICIGFDSCYSLKEFAKKHKNIRKTTIKSPKQLPEAFLDVYLNIQKGKGA